MSDDSSLPVASNGALFSRKLLGILCIVLGGISALFAGISALSQAIADYAYRTDWSVVMVIGFTGLCIVNLVIAVFGFHVVASQKFSLIFARSVSLVAIVIVFVCAGAKWMFLMQLNRVALSGGEASGEHMMETIALFYSLISISGFLVLPTLILVGIKWTSRSPNTGNQ